MELNEIVSILVNNSTAVAVLAYFIVRDWKFTQRLDTTLSTLQTSVDSLKKLIEGSEHKDVD